MISVVLVACMIFMVCMVLMTVMLGMFGVLIMSFVMVMSRMHCRFGRLRAMIHRFMLCFV
jgi:hypothetical protein